MLTTNPHIVSHVHSDTFIAKLQIGLYNALLYFQQKNGVNNLTALNTFLEA